MGRQRQSSESNLHLWPPTQPRPPPLLGHPLFVNYIMSWNCSDCLILTQICLHWRYSTLQPGASHTDLCITFLFATWILSWPLESKSGESKLWHENISKADWAKQRIPIHILSFRVCFAYKYGAIKLEKSVGAIVWTSNRLLLILKFS